MRVKRPGRWGIRALATMLAMTGAGVAQAATSDSLTVTITPTASYAVVVTTTPAGFLNLGTVALAASTQTVQPSTITVNSTFAYTGLTLQGQITSPGGTACTAPVTPPAVSQT